MAENKIARIPVASHGLHRHNYNYAWLSSINFGDCMPCYVNNLRKGEKDSPKAGLYSQLMPIAHNAFATGRYEFKAVFVPFKFVWRPWYSFDQQTQYFSSGQSSVPGRYPYVTNGVLSDVLIKNYATTTNATQNNYDVAYQTSGLTTPTYYLLTDAGRRIVRILGALGCMPSWNESDNEPMNILAIMCYIKAFADYYFPTNYVGNGYYAKLAVFFDTDNINFDGYALGLLESLEVCSLNYYETSIFDLAWDNPTTPNIGAQTPLVRIEDVTNDADYPAVVANESNLVGSPTSNADTNPSNGTAFIGGVKGPNTQGSVVSAPYSVITQYVLDTLKSVSMWIKRHQLAGAKVLDRFLASRGISLPNDSARVSYFMGKRSIEIQVSGVENNTNTNLGELAGRGVASSGNSPLSFDCKAEDDGIFLVIVSPLPDSNFPVYVDGFTTRRDYFDNFNAEYDKLGAAAVPSRVIQMTMNGRINQNIYGLNNDNVFGFLNRYWDEVQEKPRLLGDFILQSRGSQQLSAYHTFRLMFPSSTPRSHSYDFVKMSDSSQYQRLFYSSDQENLMLFLRWYGSQYKEKLPLGDSYDWDDDELNRKVSIVNGGSQR